MVDLAIVSELFGTYAAAVPWLGHALATVAIVLGGSEAQKARWLPRLASGEVLATVAFAEGKSVWFPGAWQLAGADGSLTGAKTHVANAAEAEPMVGGVAGGLAAVGKGAAVRTARAARGDRPRPVESVPDRQQRGVGTRGA